LYLRLHKVHLNLANVRSSEIRDDKGYCILLESYIHKHSEASFSHGMCPECSDGYSEDHRPDLKQVVLEMMTSQDGGIPLLMKCWDGNCGLSRINV